MAEPDSVRRKGQVDSPYAWAVAFASLFLAAAGSGTYFLVAIAIVPRAAELGVDVGSAAIPYGAAMLGMGIGGIAMGWYADRFGTFRPAVLAVLSLAAGAWIIARVESFPLIVGVYLVLFGLLGNAAFVTPLFTAATHWFERRRGVAVSLVGSGQALGGAIWPVVFHTSITNYGWHATYQGYAIFALVVMLPVALVFRRPAPVHEAVLPENGAQPATYPGLGLSPNVVTAMLCTAVVGCCIAMSMPLVHLPKYVVERGFSLGEGASILGVLMATSIVSRISWGFVCDRIGGLPTLFVTSATQATALAAMAATSSFPGLYAVAIFFGLGFGGILPCYPVILRTHLPLEGLGPRVGMIVLFGSIGMALGPEIAGRVFAETNSYSLGFAWGVAANIGNLLIVGFLNLRRLRENAALAPA